MNFKTESDYNSNNYMHMCINQSLCLIVICRLLVMFVHLIVLDFSNIV